SAVRTDGHGVQVVVLYGTLPARPPGRRIRRQRQLLDRTPAGATRTDVGAAYESQRPVIEVVGVEVVDDVPGPARPDERIEYFVVAIEQIDAAHDLVRIVLAHHARACHGIQGLADARPQHQAHVVKLVSDQDHQLGGLLG